MLLADAKDFRFNGQSATAIRLNGQLVWPLARAANANFSGGGSLSAVAVAQPGYVYDDFNRADDPTGLGPGFVIRSGALAIANGSVHPVGAGAWGYATSTVVMPSNDMEASVTIDPVTTGTDHFMIYVGANTSGECVFAYFYQGNAYFWHQGAWSSYSNIMGASYLPQAGGDTFTLRRVGTLHTILKNGTDTGISINYAVVPSDTNHRLVGFGLYSDDGVNWRTVTSFAARAL